MGCQFSSQGTVAWTPSIGVARIFLSAIRSAEAQTGQGSGIGEIVSDVVEIDLKKMINFLKQISQKHSGSNNEIIRFYLEPTICILHVIAERLASRDVNKLGLVSDMKEQIIRVRKSMP
jgi:hypothetical protein